MVSSTTAPTTRIKSSVFSSLLFCTAIAFLSFGSGLMYGQQLASSSSSSSSGVNDIKTPKEEIYSLAYSDSNGFFDDIPSTEWKLLKEKVLHIQPNTNGDPSNKRQPERWFQDNYEPDFACRHERRIGRLGDGGKWVCDPHRIGWESSTNEDYKYSEREAREKKKPCLVYSVGSNGDLSFETAVRENIAQHCEIHVFDMADYSGKTIAAGAVFHQWGISGETKGQYKTLEETVKELGHVGRVIDIFKIDCEGCEWDSYPSFFKSNAELRQILIEIHDIKGQVPSPQGGDFFKAMYENGYAVFHKEPNIRFWRFRKCVEYAFIKVGFKIPPV